MTYKEPSIFDLLEPLARALDDNGGPDIRPGFARMTGGVDIPFIIGELVRKTLHSSDMVERVARAIAYSIAKRRNEGEEPTETQVAAWLNDGVRKDAEAALEASHHAELVEALQAIDIAQEAFDAADEHAGEAEAEGWQNDPTGSCWVAESFHRANKLSQHATALRRSVLAKIGGDA